jgi:hypothetical protein
MNFWLKFSLSKCSLTIKAKIFFSFSNSFAILTSKFLYLNQIITFLSLSIFLIFPDVVIRTVFSSFINFNLIIVSWKFVILLILCNYSFIIFLFQLCVSALLIFLFIHFLLFQYLINNIFISLSLYFCFN